MPDPTLWQTLFGAAAAAPVAVKLLSEVSKLTGGVLRPWQIERVEAAKTRAEADHMVILAHAGQEVREIEIRATQRLAAVESRRQENIENVLRSAIPKLPNGEVTAPPMDQDWLARFLDGAQDVSDSELREIWASLLATEFTRPGRVSRRTLSIVKDFSRRDAEVFTRFAAMVWCVDGEWGAHAPEVENDEPFAPFGVSRADIHELEALGLVVAEGSVREVYRLSPGERVVMQYRGRTLEVRGAPREAKTPRRFTEKVQLTASGAELARTIAVNPNETYLAGVIAFLRENGHEVSDLPRVDK